MSLGSESSLPLCLQYGDLPLNYIFILSAILAVYMICKRLTGNHGIAPESSLHKLVETGDWDLRVLVPFLCFRLPPVASQAASSLPSRPSCHLLGNRAGLDN